MSCERRVLSFKEVEEVRIESCDAKEIQQLENTIIAALEQKLEKLNILIKNTNIYCDGKNILVNDRYSVCNGIIDVASAFGLDIKQVECSLRGKNYIISDKLLGALAQFNRLYHFGYNIVNQEMDDTILEILKINGFNYAVNDEVLALVNNIKKNGQYVTTRTREVTEEYEDSYFLGRSEGEWVSDAKEIESKLRNISKDAKNTVNKTNEYLRDGTAKLIYARARQMGYSVQEVKKGTQTQLVLVRCE